MAWEGGDRAGMWGRVAVRQGRKEALARATSQKDNLFTGRDLCLPGENFSDPCYPKLSSIKAF